MWVVVAPVLHELCCGAHVIDLVKVKSRWLTYSPPAKHKCGNRNDDKHPEINPIEARSRRGACLHVFVCFAGARWRSSHHP